MYNNIGLSTSRGTATSGFIQSNLAQLKYKRNDNAFDRQFERKAPRLKHANKDLLEHEIKRKIEGELLELEMRLKEGGMDEERIKEIIQEERAKKRDASKETQSNRRDRKRHHGNDSRFNGSDSHDMRAERDRKNEAFARAARIDSKTFVSGEAFDTEGQKEKQRLERLRQQQQLEQDEKMERRRRKEEKRRAKEARQESDSLKIKKEADAHSGDENGEEPRFLSEQSSQRDNLALRPVKIEESDEDDANPGSSDYPDDRSDAPHGQYPPGYGFPPHMGGMPLFPPPPPGWDPSQGPPPGWDPSQGQPPFFMPYPPQFFQGAPNGQMPPPPGWNPQMPPYFPPFDAGDRPPRSKKTHQNPTIVTSPNSPPARVIKDETPDPEAEERRSPKRNPSRGRGSRRDDYRGDGGRSRDYVSRSPRRDDDRFHRRDYDDRRYGDYYRSSSVERRNHDDYHPRGRRRDYDDERRYRDRSYSPRGRDNRGGDTRKRTRDDRDRSPEHSRRRNDRDGGGRNRRNRNNDRPRNERRDDESSQKDRDTTRDASPHRDFSPREESPEPRHGYGSEPANKRRRRRYSPDQHEE